MALLPQTPRICAWFEKERSREQSKITNIITRSGEIFSTMSSMLTAACTVEGEADNRWYLRNYSFISRLLKERVCGEMFFTCVWRC